MRFRRSPHLVTFWRDAGLEMRNYATGAHAAITPLVVEVLNEFDDWQRVAAATAGRSPAEAAAFARVVRALASRSFLEQSTHPAPESARAVDVWRDWNPAAGFFHFSTKDVVYEKSSVVAERRQRAYARRHPAPRPTKSYRRAPQIRLPDAKAER